MKKILLLVCWIPMLNLGVVNSCQAQQPLSQQSISQQKKEISLIEASSAEALIAATQDQQQKKKLDLVQFKSGFSVATKKEASDKNINLALQSVVNDWGSDAQIKADNKINISKASYDLGFWRCLQARQDLKNIDEKTYLDIYEKSFKSDNSKQIGSASLLTSQYIQQERMRGADERLKKANEFLEKNAKSATVTVTKSGLQYEVIEAGNGATIKPVDTVKVDYKHFDIDGKLKFDSEKEKSPDYFPLRGDIPEGWHELFLLMKPGARYKVYLAPTLGYGKDGSGDMVLPNELLITEFKILEVIQPPPVVD